MVEKRLYLVKNGEVWFSDQVLVIDGDDFKGKNLHYAHLGDKTTKVGANTFENNDLTQIHFHKKMKFIESKSFANNKIEKIVFSRLEVPQIAKDAFVGNPVETIIVPYETIDDYRKVLSEVEFDQEVNIISNIRMKFNKLEEIDKEESIVLVIAKPVYGDYIWRIELQEIVDFETLMHKNENQFNFGELEVESIQYKIFKDRRNHVIFYRKDEEYQDMTFEDFERIFKDVTKRKDIL